MKTKPALLFLGAIACGLAAAWPGIAFADDKVEIPNWPAPLYWVPPGAPASQSSSHGGSRTALSVSPTPLVFVALAPCRVADTRVGAGFFGQYGPPFLSVGTPRDFVIAGQCGIPLTAKAASFNFAVVGTFGYGWLNTYPAGTPAPNSSTLNYDHANQTLANAAVLLLGTGGAITIQPGGSGTDLIIDINGYYSSTGVVNSVNTLQGDVSLAAGSNVTITPSGNILTIAATGGTGFSLPYSGTVSASAAALQVGNTGSGPAVHGSASSGNAIEGSSSRGGFAGVYGQTTTDGGAGVWGLATTSAAYGVVGTATANFGTGVYGVSLGYNGVDGESKSSSNSGVYGHNDAGGFGVAGRTGGNGIAIYGDNTSSTGWSGYFTGSVAVVGSLSKGGGSFKIDHPLDPENKYLYHSFVESPDMMNIYNGVAVLDAVGEVRVEMPTWFDALNRDFRYQLTAIGAPQPNLHVRQKMTGNRFVIGGGRPGMEVSWQVTGIRQDAWANHNRIPVEEGKPEQERGRYLHPREHGHPDEDSVDWPRLEAMRSHEHPAQGK